MDSFKIIGISVRTINKDGHAKKDEVSRRQDQLSVFEGDIYAIVSLYSSE